MISIAPSVWDDALWTAQRFAWDREQVELVRPPGVSAELWEFIASERAKRVMRGSAWRAAYRDAQETVAAAIQEADRPPRFVFGV